MKSAFKIATILFLIITFASCDENNSGTIEKVLIEQDWKIKTVRLENENLQIQPLFDAVFTITPVEIDFKADGTYLRYATFLGMPVEEGQSEGTWSISEDEKTFTMDDDDYIVLTATKNLFEIKFSSNAALQWLVDNELDSETEDTNLIYVFEAI